jgi:hypothetical protein
VNKPGSGNTSADIAGQLAAAIVARLMAEHLAHGEASVRFDGSAQRKPPCWCAGGLVIATATACRQTCYSPR